MNKFARNFLARTLVALAAIAAPAALAKPPMIVPYEGPRADKPREFTTEGWPVKFNLGAIRGLKPGDEVELTLPNGTVHSIVFDQLQDHEPGVTSFVGYYKGSPEKLRTIITTGPGGSFGQIGTPAGDYRLFPGQGHDWLVDMVAEAPHLPPVDLKRDSRHMPPMPKSLQPQSLFEPAYETPIAGVTAPATAKASLPNVVVDLLIVYTNGYAARLGGNLTTRLNNLIVAANTAYADSDVAITLRLVRAEMVNYPDLPAVDDDVALDAITPVGPVNAAFTNVESIRNAYGADMVALLRDYTNSNGGSGIAWVAGTMGAGAAPYMYSVTSGCVTGCDFVFIHEVGHNMGNMHDRATSAWQGGGSGSFPYSYGYYSCSGGSQALACNPFTSACPSQPECNTPRSGTNNFSDIMAYFHASTTRNLRFSNPAIALCRGALGTLAPCGIPETQPDSANTALSMNNNRVALSALRATAVAASTTTTVASSPNPSIAGQAVTLSATVASPGAIPTGTVNFRSNGTTVAGCGAVALSAGAASCTTTGLAQGALSITAVYSGAAGFATSTSAAITQTVNPAVYTPTVTLSSSPNPSNIGQPVTLHAVVAGASGTPTGGVSFMEGPNYLPGCSYVPLSGGTADCVATSLSLGGHAFTVAYGGNSTYYNAVSGALSHTVQSDPSVPTNVAAALAGATASASSTYNATFPASAAINGDRAGRNWGNGSGWNDATSSAYPDWLQVDFFGTHTIDRVVVYTLQDNVTSPVEPTDAMTFTSYGVVDFTVQGWNGSSWVTLATVTNNNLVKRTVSFAAFSTSRIRIHVTRAFGGYSHITEVEAFTASASPSPATSLNAALASNGASATASSTYGSAFPASAAINGDTAGTGWGSGSGWNDGTASAFPDWLQVNFNQARNIDRVVVYTLQDNVTAPSQPTDTMTFTSYGVVDFDVQGWNGAGWVTLASVTNNNLVKRTVTFAAYSTDRIRIHVTRAFGGYSHITEVEAWTAGASVAQSNVALRGTVSASSTYSPGFPASAVVNGDRAGLNWANGSGWNDATANAFPDWIQVGFAGGLKTIDRVVLYTLQDNVSSPVEPTDAMTFTSYGIVDFTVEGWTGASWVTLGRVTNNNLVKRTITFPPVAVDRIFVNVTRAFGGYTHITEIEAWGN